MFFHDDLGYAGVRTYDNRLYAEYQTGKKEYYEMMSEPYQLDSEHEKLSRAYRDGYLSRT